MTWALLLPGLVAALLALVLIVGAIVTGGIAAKVMRAFPPRGRFISTRAGRVHVMERGEGPPVVLIHGLGGQIGNYSHSLIDHLSSRYQVIAIDRPGSGYSDPMPKEFTGVRRHADVVAEVLSVLDAGPALIVGHSLGGAVALALAIDHAEQVGGLCLLAPLTQVQPTPPAAFRGLQIGQTWRWLIANTLAIPLSLLRRQKTLEALFGPDPAPADFPTRGLGLLSLRPQAFIGASTDMVHANDDMPFLTSRYATISRPTAILFGRDDRILDPQVHGQGLADILPGAVLTWIGGGHMIPVTAPESAVAVIDETARKVFVS